MVTFNAILYLSLAWYSILSFNQFFIIKIFLYWFFTKNIGNRRNNDIFLNFRLTEIMIFPSIEMKKNIWYLQWVFLQMLSFMQWDQLSWKMSRLHRSEILGLFLNTLTAAGKYSRHYIFPRSIQTLLSKKPKTFFSNFQAVSKICIKFSTFWKKKKNEPHSLSTCDINDSDWRSYLNV